jgi:hypothetical protein
MNALGIRKFRKPLQRTAEAAGFAQEQPHRRRRLRKSMAWTGNCSPCAKTFVRTWSRWHPLIWLPINIVLATFYLTIFHVQRMLPARPLEQLRRCLSLS